MISNKADLKIELYRQNQVMSKLKAENKQLREGLMSAYTHCLTGSVINDADGNLFSIAHYETWHMEVREMMRQALKETE